MEMHEKQEQMTQNNQGQNQARGYQLQETSINADTCVEKN